MLPPDKPRQCPNCGTEVASSDQVCWRCYRSLPPPTPPQPQPSRPRRRKRVPVSALLLGAVIFVLGGYLWYVWSSPTTALVAYLRAEQARDVKTAYRLLSVRSQKMIRPEELTRSRRARDSALVFAVRSVEREDSSAKVTLEVSAVTANSIAPPRSTYTMYMVREGGGWKVDMVRTSQVQAGDVMVGEHGWFRLWSTGPARK